MDVLDGELSLFSSFIVLRSCFAFKFKNKLFYLLLLMLDSFFIYARPKLELRMGIMHILMFEVF